MWCSFLPTSTEQFDEPRKSSTAQLENRLFERIFQKKKILQLFNTNAQQT